MKNYYEILEIDKNASDEIIKVAYKSLVKKYHPDLKEGNQKLLAEEKIKQINDAYDILSDPQKRAEYNKTLINENISKEQYNIIAKENIKLKMELNYLKNNYYNNSNIYPYTKNNYYQNPDINYSNYDYASDQNKDTKYNYSQNINSEKNVTNNNSKNLFNNLNENLKSVLALLLTFLIFFIILSIPFIREAFINLFVNSYLIIIIVIIIAYIYFFRNKQ